MGGIITSTSQSSTSTSFVTFNSLNYPSNNFNFNNNNNNNNNNNHLSSTQSIIISRNIILNSLTRRQNNYHPDLRLLRLLLTCDYGRPKFIKYLLKIKPLCSEILNDKLINSIQFISKYEIFDDLSDYKSSNSNHSYNNKQQQHVQEQEEQEDIIQLNNNLNSDENEKQRNNEMITHTSHNYIPIQMLINSCLSNILVLGGISYYHNFMNSSEGEDWIRYQHLLTETRGTNCSADHTLSESTNALSAARSHIFVQQIDSADIMCIMNKPSWIVTLAKTFDNIPFPISIHSFNLPDQVNKKYSSKYPLLYCNQSYIDMTGYSKEDLGCSEYNFGHLLNQSLNINSNSDKLILKSLKNGKKLRIVIKSETLTGNIYQNYQSYHPLKDMKGNYRYMIIIHCNFTEKSNDLLYLNKLNILIETLLPSSIFCGETIVNMNNSHVSDNNSSLIGISAEQGQEQDLESCYLLSYFYDSDSNN